MHFDVWIARQSFEQARFQELLAKGVALWVAVLQRSRLDARELATRPGKVMHAITLHHIGQHAVDEAGALQGAQALVVDRYRARLAHGAGMSLQEQGANAVQAKQVGQGQSGRAGADDGHRVVRHRHVRPNCA